MSDLHNVASTLLHIIASGLLPSWSTISLSAEFESVIKSEYEISIIYWIKSKVGAQWFQIISSFKTQTEYLSSLINSWSRPHCRHGAACFLEWQVIRSHICLSSCFIRCFRMACWTYTPPLGHEARSGVMLLWQTDITASHFSFPMWKEMNILGGWGRLIASGFLFSSLNKNYFNCFSAPVM